MEWIIGIVLGIIEWFVILYSPSSPDFWKMTRQHPKEAWEFFNTQSEWHIGAKPQSVKVTGPFRVVNPYTNKLVTIYCNSDEIEQSEKKFMQLFKAG